MVFTNLSGIKLPRELFNAAKNGKLVVFAGAGVSMQGEQKLPDFVNLVEGISAKIDTEHKLGKFDNKKDSCEEYLGKLEKQYGGIVRVECAKALSVGTCAEIHRNIISLFGMNAVRVVTTNFDQRFEQAANELNIQIRVFSGPALPIGDNFEGIVHLHGSIDFPNEMILNAVDFGKAYVSDGWASRFLVKMFSCFTVLFVGYSFSDTLVQYLVRSISADVKGRVFALESKTDKLEDWLKRGVTPISFDSFDQLPELFYEWNRRNGNSVYEHSRIVEHVAAVTLDAPSEEKEELVDLLKDSGSEEQAAYAKVYVRVARNFSAVKLLVELGFDDFLFKENLSVRDSVFSSWVAKNFAVTDYLQLMLLATENDKKLSKNLCSSILTELCFVDHDNDCLSAWASYLTPSMINNNGSASFCFYQVIQNCNEHKLAFSWIQKLFTIKAICQRDYFDQEPHGLKPAFLFDGDSFSEQLTDAIFCYADSLGWGLFWFLVNQLEEARKIETEYGVNPDAFDSWSFGRSAIEEHEQDEYSRGLLSVLLAVLRKTGSLLVPGCSFGVNVIERCISSDAYLVKRMGLYLLYYVDVSPDFILDFLIKNSCLRNPYLIHETFVLLSMAYPVAKRESKAAIIDEIRVTYPDITDGNDAYGRFNVLKWLEKFNGMDEVISNELKLISKQFPDFQTRDYPDLNSYMSISWGQDDERFKISEEEFCSEKLLELCSMAEESHSVHRIWDIVSAPMRQYPRKGLDVAKQLLSAPENSCRKMAKIALLSIRWEDIEEKSLRDASEVIMVGLQCEDTYPFAVGALRKFIESLKELILEKEYLWRQALDFAFDKMEWLSNEEYGVTDSDKCDWYTLSINHASGALIGSVSKITCAIMETDKSKARKFGKQYMGALISRLDTCDECSKCLAASFLAEINIWIFVEMELMERAFSQIFMPESPLLIPAWQGLSYVNRLSENSWNVLKRQFEQFPHEIYLHDESLGHLGSLFVWGAIVFGSNDERKSAVAISSAVSPDVCSSVSFRLLDWVAQLADDVRIVEWESWLDGAIRSMFAMDDNFKIAGHYLVRWLEKCGCLASKVGSILIEWRKRKCDGIAFDNGSLSKLVNNGAFTDDDRALLLAFFLLNACECYSFGEFEDAAKRLDCKSMSKDVLSELRDTFILCYGSSPSCLE